MDTLWSIPTVNAWQGLDSMEDFRGGLWEGSRPSLCGRPFLLGFGPSFSYFSTHTVPEDLRSEIPSTSLFFALFPFFPLGLGGVVEATPPSNLP